MTNVKTAKKSSHTLPKAAHDQEALLREELARTKERYHSLVETAPDVIFTLSIKDHTIQSLNPAFEKISGWPRSEWLGRPFAEIVYPEDLPLALATYEKILKGKQPPPIELRFLSGKQPHTFMEVIATPLKEGGEIVAAFGIARDITERRKAEKALRASDEQFRTLAALAPVGIYFTDPDGNCLYANPAWCKMAGLSLKEALGKGWVKGLHPDDRDLIFSRWKQMVKSEGQWGLEYRFQARDGKSTWVYGLATPQHDDSGRVTRYIGVNLDITERKKAESIMHEQGAAMKASMDGMAILNKEEQYVYINDAHAKVYGYKNSAELIGKKWYVLYDEKELKRFQNHIMPAFQKTGQWRGEAVGKRKDGSLFPQEISLTAIEGGGLVCVVRDISERKAVEDALKKNENLLRAVFDAMPHWVFVKDCRSRMLLANQRMATDYGMTPEELQNVPTEETPVGNEEEKAFFVGVDHQVVTTGEQVEIPEEKITRPSGEVRYLHTIKVPLKDADGKIIGLVGVAEDITERKKIQEELDKYHKHLEDLVEERTRELQHSERLAATGRLAASIAHEINNPLQGITTHLEIIKQNLPADFTKMKNYESVRSNIEKIRSIVTKLLDSFRGSDNNKTDINVNEIVETVVSLTEHQLAQKHIRLELKLAKTLPLVFGWRKQLHQVFLNLILNAYDSIKSKTGTITVATSLDGNFISVDIKDTGEGIKKEDLNQLFEPFFTTKNESGTGLGLFVSRGIIKEHEGFIKVKSDPGKGSTFTVLLPVKAQR